MHQYAHYQVCVVCDLWKSFISYRRQTISEFQVLEKINVFIGSYSCRYLHFTLLWFENIQVLDMFCCWVFGCCVFKSCESDSPPKKWSRNSSSMIPLHGLKLARYKWLAWVAPWSVWQNFQCSLDINVMPL